MERYTPDFFEPVDHFAKTAAIGSGCILPGSRTEPVLVSIAIPTYKRAGFLKEALESALAQRPVCDFEILVVDNNPLRDDETEQLMRQYKETGIVSYYKNDQNLGMGGNWNRCLFLSRGKWVVLLHDDDRLEASFLQKTLPYLQKLDPGILQTRKYSAEGPAPRRLFRNIKKVGRLDMLYGHALDVPSGIVYNREEVLRAGGFNDALYPSLDYCFHTVFLQDHPVYILNENLTYYRLSVNASQSLQVQEAWLIDGFFLTKQLLRRYGLPDWIVMPFLPIRTARALNTIEQVWHSGLQVPSRLPVKQYPWWRRAVSLAIITLCVRYEKIKARIACIFNLIKSPYHGS